MKKSNLRILSIGIDKSVLEEKSGAFKRQALYSSFVAKYVIVTLGSGQALNSGNLTVVPTNSSRIGFLFSAYSIAKRFANEVDVITVQDPFVAGLVGWLLKRKFRKPLEVQLHGDDVFNPHWIGESFVNRILNFVGSFVLKRADVIRAVSQRIKSRVISEGVSEEKIAVVPVFTDVKRFSVKKKSWKPFALFVGRLVPQKNIFFLLDVWKKVILSCPSARLVIVGDGFLRKQVERAVAGSPSLKNSVDIVGFADPREYYKEASVFVLPSIYEGWGLVVIEALSAGVPVVMSEVGCAEEVVIDGKNGFVLPVNDLEGFAQATVRLLNDSKLRSRLSSEGKKTVKNLNTAVETVELYLKNWERALR